MASTTQYPAWINQALAAFEQASGFTVDAKDGLYEGTGYGVSPYPERNHLIAVGQNRQAALLRFADKNADLLTLPGHYIGGWEPWHSPGVLDLDVSVVTGSRREAAGICDRHDQQCYYDFEREQTGRIA